METADFDYLLPPECIAATPAPKRDDARLLVMDRGQATCKHARFGDLLGYLPPRSLLVLTDTRVFPVDSTGMQTSDSPLDIADSSGNEAWTSGACYGDKGTYFADVTGDGMADAIVVNNGGIVVRRSAGNRFTPNEEWTTGPFYGDKGTYFANVDVP